MKKQKNTILMLVALMCVGKASALLASSEGEHAVERKYVTAPPSPSSQSDESVQAKSAGCLS